MPKNNHNLQQDIKIAEIQTDVKWIKNEIIDIKNNHLAGIYKKLEANKIWLIGVLGSIIATLVAVILK